jgi:hypothetical protein
MTAYIVISFVLYAPFGAALAELAVGGLRLSRTGKPAQRPMASDSDFEHGSQATARETRLSSRPAAKSTDLAILSRAQAR